MVLCETKNEASFEASLFLRVYYSCYITTASIEQPTNEFYYFTKYFTIVWFKNTIVFTINYYSILSCGFW